MANKPYAYHAKRHYAPYEIECATLDECTGLALSDIEYGDAWPVKITHGDVTLWEQSGPFRTEESLKQFIESLTP
jgi:hypothetical protein